MRPSSKALILILFLAFLILSSNTNAQWVQQNFPTTENLRKVRFANEMVGWILGDDCIYKTSDGGMNWMPQDSTLGDWENGLYILNDETVFYNASPSDSTNWERGIRRTTDGGLTWQTVDSLPYSYPDFEFLNDQVGFAVGADVNDINAVRMTTDGGTTWNTISTNFPETKSWLYGITFVDQQGWIISYDEYVYHSTDGGLNWMLQDSIQAITSTRDILFMTQDSGWVVGGLNGMIVARTTDGGDHWIVDPQIVPNYLFEVDFVDSKTGWFTGIGIPNHMARTTNGGIDWQYQTLIPPNASNGFRSISMINENIGWAVGDFGVIYKTTNGGIVAIDENPDKLIPGIFALDQNYPNPFNPTTRIHYSLPSSDQVTLRVYNITGQLVTTLVNKQQATGTHEVIFEADQLPGGVYFYKVSSGSWSQTRKMLLLK